MAKKKQTEPAEHPESDPTAGPPFFDEIEGAAATSGEAKKEWTKRPDPFGFESIDWADGYRVSLKESDANREIYIQFGSGARADQPQNFEAIKKMFKEEYKIYWDGKVQGWAKELKPGIAPLVKEHNKRVRAAVEEAFYKAVALEEAVRGPSLSELVRQKGGNAR